MAYIYRSDLIALVQRLGRNPAPVDDMERTFRRAKKLLAAGDKPNNRLFSVVEKTNVFRGRRGRGV